MRKQLFSMLSQWACSPGRIALAVALLMGASHAPAHSQQPTPGAIAAAKEYVVIKGAMTMFSPIIPGVIENAKNIFLQQNPNLGQDLNAVAADLRKRYEFKRGDLQNEIAKVYAAQFTEQELKQAIEFYKTPLGKKLLTAEPIAIEQTLQAAQNFGDTFSREAMEAIRAEMRKKGHTL